MTTAFMFPGQGSQAVGMGKSLAESFAAAGAGWVHPQASLEPKAFAQFLTSLRSQQHALQQAAAAALTHGKPDAAERLADLAERIAGKHSA